VFEPQFMTVVKGSYLTQWRAEVCWYPGRLLDWMPPYQILILSSGVWWSLLLV